MRWSEEEEQYLKENYSEKKAKEIADELNRTSDSVYGHAWILGLSQEEPHWSREEENFLKENAKKMPTRDITKEIGRSFYAIHCKAAELGLSMKKLPSVSHRYDVNRDFFHDINSKKKAYWLGFLWADGCVYTRNGAQLIRIEIHNRDEHLLYDMKEDLEATYPINPTRNSKIDLKIFSHKMCDDLIDHGVVPDKSHKNIRPDINKKYENHFVRGLFDGDGSVVKSNTNYSVRICNTETTTNWVLEITRKNLDVGGGVYRSTNSEVAYRWTICGRIQVERFSDWIYDNQERYLKRKYNRFQDFGLLYDEGN